MLRLAALVTVETQLFILMGETLEHPQVHELLIPNMDLQSMKPGEISASGGSSLQQEGWQRLDWFEDGAVDKQ